MKAQLLIETARSFIGVPFRHQGFSRNGVDCWGLVRLTCETLEVFPADFKPLIAYGRQANCLLASAQKYCAPIIKPEVGALLLMRWRGDQEPAHMALISKRGPYFYLIHANSDLGKVVEHGYQHPWTIFRHSLWRLPGIEQ